MNQTPSTAFYLYYWRGKNGQGQKVQGKMLGYTEVEIRQHLKTIQISPIKIKKRSPSFWTKRRHLVTSKDITLFSRQMTTMLSAGLPLNDTLVLIKSGVKKVQMNQIITRIQNQLGSGASFSQALNLSSRLFDKFYCQLIAIGEQTGQLEQALARITFYREKSEVLRSKVLKVMIYPCIVFALAILVAVAMLIFVIPTFTGIFESFHADLPWFTQKILNLSNYLQTHIFYYLAIIAFASLIMKTLIKNSKKLQLKLSKLALKIPIIGNILTKAATARFARTLATTFSSGVPLLTGLHTAGNTTNNTHFEEVIAQISKQTAGGKALHLAIKETGAFPDTMRQMIMIGEESGYLDDMLHKIAVLYEEQVDNRIDNIGKIFEPIIIVVLGLLIGSLVVAMYLPMFNLMSIM